MIKIYTIKNTVGRGLSASVYIKGQEVEECDFAVTVGPFVIARIVFDSPLTVSTGKFYHSYRFGRGSVTVKELPNYE